MQYPKPIQTLIDFFRTLPGVGTKTAERFVLHLVGIPDKQRIEFAKAIHEIQNVLHRCRLCSRIDTHDPCAICADGRRDQSIICVVSDQQDVMAIEKTNECRDRDCPVHGYLKTHGRFFEGSRRRSGSEAARERNPGPRGMADQAVV